MRALSVGSDPPVTVRFLQRTFDMVRAHLLRDENEEFCFLFAHVVEADGRRIFLVDKAVFLDPDCYRRRTRTAVVVDARAKNTVYARFAASTHSGLVNCHSHPFENGDVRFSETDDRDDRRELAWQYDQFPVGKRNLGRSNASHALSMVFGQATLDGRGYRTGDPPTLPPIDRVQVVGDTFRIVLPTSTVSADSLTPEQADTYDRQIRAFGTDGQVALARLRVGLVGAGGIGSILAEGLARLGVGDLVIVDPDALAASNLNRWQGGRPEDVGRLKVDVVSDRLRQFAPGIRLHPVAAALTDASALAALKGCDVLIGAVDNHLARYLLNRLSVQYLMPYLDAASAVARNGDDDRLSLRSRLGVVVPGTTACLDCSQVEYYDRRALAPHLYDPATRRALTAAGYVQDRPEMTAPAVMPLNMLAAAPVLIELLNLVGGFAPLARYARVDWLHHGGGPLRADTGNFPEGPSVGCLACAGLLGAGDSEPLPQLGIMPESGAGVANEREPWPVA